MLNNEEDTLHCMSRDEAFADTQLLQQVQDRLESDIQPAMTSLAHLVEDVIHRSKPVVDTARVVLIGSDDDLSYLDQCLIRWVQIPVD
jgi:hypothetical protein